MLSGAERMNNGFRNKEVLMLLLCLIDVYRHVLKHNDEFNLDVLLWPTANVMCFLIFWRRKCMLSKSSTLYLMAIAIADTAVLMFIVVLEISVKYFTVEPFWAREPWCSMRDVFTYGAYNVSTWLIVAFTAERFLAITTWRFKNRICNSRCAVRIIGSIFFMGLLLAVPYYWAYISTTLTHILPFIFIGLLNASGHKVAPLLRSRKRKSVVLLVTVSMTFVLLSITRSITQLILRTQGLFINRDDYSLDINVAADIGTMLSLTNAAVNMYLYACTQTKFRQEVIASVKYCLWRGCLARDEHSLI
uniref:G-protein coupled receptors family 1 profile domain-containing protein n=1 Tax=Astyanax mexicanus TaxID=7994 RepID=A0A3B1K7D2_ASTMX